MAERQLPSPEVLRQLLRYEADTGKLFWLPRGPEWFSDGEGRYSAMRMAKIWNSKYAGAAAMDCIDRGLGYRKGSLDGQKLYAHRVAWAMQTGEWPEDDIDHINGDRADNRWANLRAVPRRINAKNSRIRCTNSSGMMGVASYGRHGRWRARIMIDGHTKNIGCFDTYEQACAARKDAEARLGFHPNHGRD